MKNITKNPWFLFAAAFVAVVVITIVNNYRSPFFRQLNGPLSGTGELASFSDKLAVISRDNEIYVWKWNDLSAWPQVGSVAAQKAAAMDGDSLIWVPKEDSSTLVISNLKGDRIVQKLSLERIKKWKYLETSSNGKYAAIAFEPYDDVDGGVKLAVVSPDLTGISEILTENIEGKSKLDGIGISNDGAVIAAVGRKEAGWILAADTRSKKVLWEQTVNSSTELNAVIFSPDGRYIYASEPGRVVYMFETVSGKAVKQFVMDKYEYEASPNNPQTILLLAASPDGRLLAASTEPAQMAYVWDVETGRKIALYGGQNTISGLSFSPDSSMLVTGILVRSNIYIWKIKN